MIKKLILFLFVLFCGVAQSAQVVNVEYVHNAIKQKCDITVPYNPELTNPRVAANMRYLLTAVDVANEMLNGEKTTDYGNGEFATVFAADTVATDTAVETLVKKVVVGKSYVFEFVHDYMTRVEDSYGDCCVSRDSSYLIGLAAAGTFFIDWGDGTEDVIEKTSVGKEYYGHEYAGDGTYTVRMGGRAEAYAHSTDPISDSVVEFGGGYTSCNGKCLITPTKISGCLGCIFPTLADGSQPCFMDLFRETYITTIPEELFNGIYGVPRDNMFREAFSFCGGLRSIPRNLFSGLDTSVDLPSRVFNYTFFGGGSLTGPSAQINGRYLYEIWPDATKDQVGGCYINARGLSDYADMPKVWTEY